MIKRVREEARRLAAQWRKAAIRRRIGQKWRQAEEGEGFTKRVYPDYETYLAHQRTKLDAFRPQSIAKHDVRFRAALGERLAALPFPMRKLRVLCLAARQGSEVKAFIDHGAFAIGIDLNPGKDNRYVVVGDFHDLQFADASVDLVYTNSLDHVFELDRLMAEILRVLTPEGHLLLEVGSAGMEGQIGFYEAMSWKSTEELLERVLSFGFTLESRSSFDVPWPGDHLVLRRTQA
jgi:SAM-dependent methyltransferase